jgi:hypothetical protein
MAGIVNYGIGCPGSTPWIMWACFSTPWNFFCEIFHAMENSFPCCGKVLSLNYSSTWMKTLLFVAEQHDAEINIKKSLPSHRG